MPDETPESRPRGEVLTNLPHHRPHRRSAKRGPAAAGSGDAPAPATARSAAKSTSKPAPARAAAKPSAAKPKATAAKPAAPKRAPAKPRTAAGSAPPPPHVPSRGWDAEEPQQAPGGADLVATAVQAAGELAQVGLAVGVQAFRNAIARLPRP